MCVCDIRVADRNKKKIYIYKSKYNKIETSFNKNYVPRLMTNSHRNTWKYNIFNLEALTPPCVYSLARLIKSPHFYLNTFRLEIIISFHIKQLCTLTNVAPFPASRTSPLYHMKRVN